MDFFENQEVARRKTGLLVGYFVVAVVLMIAALYGVVVWLFAFTDQHDPQAGVDWWRPEILLGVAAATLTVIGLGSLYKMIELRAGGERIATMLGGRRLIPNSTAMDEQRLLNIVEEMALAAGTPVPPVYLLDNENGINAFAAGFTPNDAVIGINRGTLDYLSRDELQGVIGHEFSHILNGDMRLNFRLVGLLNGILLLAVIGYYLMRFGGGSSHRSSGRDRGGGQVVILGLAALVIGYVGLFFARLIKAAVSREREYLADASAVQFTRNPDGIAGALTKIGGLAAGSRMNSPEAESASHMFFGSFRQAMFGALSTHPPLVQRIQRINPRFDGKFPPTVPPLPRTAHQPQRDVAKTGLPRIGPSGPLRKVAMGDKFPLDPLLAMAAVGTLDTQHVAYASELIQSLPAVLKNAVYEAFSARAVVFAMLLDDDAQVRARQLELLREQLGPPTEEESVKLAPLVIAAGAAARLPLIEIVQSTLQGLSPTQFQAFCRAVDELVKADQRITLFEFVLQRVLIRHLQRHFSGAEPPVRVRYPAINGVLPEAVDLLSALAFLGHSDSSEARRAFDLAAAALSVKPPVPMRSRGDSSFRVIGDALDKLAQSSPPVKKRVLSAAIVAVAADGTVTVGEAELLRAIAVTLGCPMPPLFAGPLAK